MSSEPRRTRQPRNSSTASTPISSQRINRRSFTRSPTPIKYNYDIYQKRSPTFGRRCPVLNRRLRPSIGRQDSEKKSFSSNSHLTVSKPRHSPQSVSSVVLCQKSFSPSRVDDSGKTSINSSYFQHDNRDSRAKGRAFNHYKRKQRRSPVRWQHDLFDGDEGQPSAKTALKDASES